MSTKVSFKKIILWKWISDLDRWSGILTGQDQLQSRTETGTIILLSPILGFYISNSGWNLLCQQKQIIKGFDYLNVFTNLDDLRAENNFRVLKHLENGRALKHVIWQ